jgi:hypothetical protein
MKKKTNLFPNIKTKTKKINFSHQTCFCRKHKLAKEHSRLAAPMKKTKIKVLFWTWSLIISCSTCLSYLSVPLCAFWFCKEADSVRVIWCCGLSLLASSSFAMLGCLLRDSRFFSLASILCLPISVVLSIFTLFKFIHFYLCKDLSLFFADKEQKLIQYAFEVFFANGMVMFLVLIVVQLALAVLCSMSPRFLNESLRIHRIVLRKIVLFQPSFSDVNPAFYRY